MQLLNFYTAEEEERVYSGESWSAAKDLNSP